MKTMANKAGAKKPVVILGIKANQLYSVDAVARALSFRVKTLRNWKLAGKGPYAVRVNNSIRYRGCDVHDWLKQNMDDDDWARVTGQKPKVVGRYSA